MFVCICNGLNEDIVRTAAQSSDSSCVHEVYDALGCAIDCGQCIPVARAIIGDVRQNHGSVLIAAE
jgi:bacterioferritin-associated ferredoxin